MKTKSVLRNLVILGAALVALRCAPISKRGPETTLKPITYQDYLEVVKRDKYFATRWRYFSIVTDLVHQRPPESCLELGARGFPLVKGAETMDITDSYGKLTYLHDATVVPWPIPDKKYDLFISCEVWEHLGDGQKKAFREVKRVSRRAIFSFPYMWPRPKNPRGEPVDLSHVGIDEAKIAEWTLGETPKAILHTEDRRYVVYYFEFGT